jgi:hypothetical protein
MISNDWTASVLRELEEGDGQAPAFPPPPTLSYSAGSFFLHQNGALGVLMASLDAAVFADNAAFVASKIVRQDLLLPKGFDPHQPLSDTPGPHLRRLGSVQRPLMEMLLIRLADNLTTYVLDVAGECIKARPGLLKSSKEQLSTEAILAVATMEELQASLIERKLMAIAYLSLDKQIDWMVDQLGVADVKRQPCFPNLVELLEARNCMVHNRARVGPKYLRALAPYGVSATVGQLLEPSVEEVFVAAKSAATFVSALDAALVEKFGLKLVPLDRSPEQG